MVTRQPVFGSVLLTSLLVLLLAQFAERSAAATRPEDDFWTAPVLTGFSHEIDASILGATPTSDLWWSDSGGPSVDLWWQVVMPVDGILEARLAGLDPQDLQDWRLELRTGEFPTGRVVGHSDGANSSLGRAARGQRVHARVRMNQSRLATLRGTAFRLVLRVRPLPANRTLETAVPLAGRQFDHELDYAGTEPVWFQWVAPRTEWVRLAQNGRETRLSASPVEALAGDPTRAAFYSTGGVTFSAEAGKRYWFGLTTAVPFWGTVESVRISLRPVVPEPGTEAANDARDRATLLTGDRWNLTGDTTFATGDSRFAQELFAATRENAAGRDLWWQWGAPEDGDLVIQHVGPYFPVGLWIRRPGGTWTKWRWDFPRTQVVAGEFLEFAVDGERKMLGNGPLWDVAPGPFTFSGRFLPRPPNDRWAAAEPLTGTEVSWLVPEDGAVAEPGSPVDAGRWWRWVPPRDGVAWCHFVETRSPSSARWFSGDSLGALVPVPPDWRDTPHLTPVKAGATHYLWLPKEYAGRVELRLLNPATNTAPESARLLTGIFNEVEQENLSTLGQAAHWFRWTAPATGTFVCRPVGSPWESTGSPSLPVVRPEIRLFRESDLGKPFGVGVSPYFNDWSALTVTAGEAVWIRAIRVIDALNWSDPHVGVLRFETELVPFRLMPADSAAALNAGRDNRFQVEALDGWQTNSITRIIGPDRSVLGNGLPFETESYIPTRSWWETWPPDWNTYVTLETADGRTLVATSPDLPIRPAGDSFSSPLQLAKWESLFSWSHLEIATPDPGTPAELAPGVWLAWRSLLGGPADLSLSGTNLIATVFQGTNLSDLRMLVRMETTTAGVASNRLALDAGIELRIHVSGPAQPGYRWFGLKTEAPTGFSQSMPPPGELRAGDTWEFHLSPPAGATPTPRVEFVADGVLVASLSNSPWRLAWTNLSPGWHSIGARMIGAAGDIVEFPATGFGVSVTNDTFARRVTVTGDSLPGGWSQWTAPATGLLELPGQSGRSVFLVKAETLGPSVSYLGEPLWRQYPLYPVQAGQTYAFSLDPLRAHPLPFRLRRQTPADWAEGAISLTGDEPALVMPSLPGSLEEDERGLAAACPEIVQSLWWRWRAPTNGWLSFIPGPELEATCHTFEPGIRDNRLDPESASGNRRWLVKAGRTIDLRLLLPPVAPGAMLGRLHFAPQGMLKSFRHLEAGAAEVVWYPLSSWDTWLGSVASLDSEHPDWRRIIRLADEEFLEEPATLAQTNRIRLPAGESARFFRVETDEPEIDDDDDDD